MTMNKYRLNGHFEEDLKVIAKAHQEVTLVKHTAGDSDSSSVAWVSFKPWQQNAIEWENTFAIYASNSEVQSKATINKLSDKIATSGVQYDFANGGFIAPKMDDLPAQANTYYVKNSSDNYSSITIGLAQEVVTNDILPMEEISLMTDSGKMLATTNIPKDVIENAENFSIIYDEEKKSIICR